MQTDRDRLIELLDKAKEEYANDITDHTETDYIVECLLNNGVIVPPCKFGNGIWVIDREDGEAVDISCVMFLAKSKGFIISTCWIDDYDLDETLEYLINETQNNFNTDLKVYPDEDCFLAKEEAEEKLREYEDNAD